MQPLGHACTLSLLVLLAREPYIDCHLLQVVQVDEVSSLKS